MRCGTALACTNQVRHLLELCQPYIRAFTYFSSNALTCAMRWSRIVASTRSLVTCKSDQNLFWSFRGNHGYGHRGDAFLTADETHGLVGGGLDADAGGRDAKGCADVLLHRFAVG